MKWKHVSMYNNEISNVESTKPENRVITKEGFRQQIAEFIVYCDQPFTIVENPYFIDLVDFCSGGNEACKLFSAQTAKEDIDKMYVEFKTNAKKVLQSNAAKISFIIDCWTSSNQHPFQGVIARYISNDWELKSVVIDLTVLRGDHKGKNIANAFWNVLVDYGIVEKLLSVTTDNASNMDTLFDELERLFEAYGIPSTYPSDDESDGEDEVEKVGSENAKVLPVVAKMRKGVVAIRNSPQRRELFEKQCAVTGIKHKTLLRDVRTRFNATLTMMERAEEMKQPFDMTLNCIPKLRKYCLNKEDIMYSLSSLDLNSEQLVYRQLADMSRISIFTHLYPHDTDNFVLVVPRRYQSKIEYDHILKSPLILVWAPVVAMVAIVRFIFNKFRKTDKKLVDISLQTFGLSLGMSFNATISTAAENLLLWCFCLATMLTGMLLSSSMFQGFALQLDILTINNLEELETSGLAVQVPMYIESVDLDLNSEQLVYRAFANMVLLNTIIHLYPHDTDNFILIAPRRFQSKIEYDHILKSPLILVWAPGFAMQLDILTINNLEELETSGLEVQVPMHIESVE
ncbi:putative AC9 transposase, partial [Pseudolycoriella hygida]